MGRSGNRMPCAPALPAKSITPSASSIARPSGFKFGLLHGCMSVNPFRCRLFHDDFDPGVAAAPPDRRAAPVRTGKLAHQGIPLLPGIFHDLHGLAVEERLARDESARIARTVTGAPLPGCAIAYKTELVFRETSGKAE